MIFLNYDQESLDAQYDIRPPEAEFQGMLFQWKEWSERAGRDFIVKENVAYGDKPSEIVDIFPSKQKNSPIHLFIHGGYWKTADKSLFRFQAQGLVPHGVTYITLNHTLAPGASLDEIVSECRNAVSWVYHNAEDISGDADRIFISGHSSGGHLAAMLASTDWPGFSDELPADLIKGMCAISGLFDLEPIRLCYLNETLKLDEETVERNSPMQHLPSWNMPVILAIGGLETDEYFRHTNEYADLLKTKGFPIRKIEIPACDHYAVVDKMAITGNPLNQAVLEQMKA